MVVRSRPSRRHARRLVLGTFCYLLVFQPQNPIVADPSPDQQLDGRSWLELAILQQSRNYAIPHSVSVTTKRRRRIIRYSGDQVLLDSAETYKTDFCGSRFRHEFINQDNNLTNPPEDPVYQGVWPYYLNDGEYFYAFKDKGTHKDLLPTVTGWRYPSPEGRTPDPMHLYHPLHGNIMLAETPLDSYLSRFEPGQFGRVSVDEEGEIVSVPIDFKTGAFGVFKISKKYDNHTTEITFTQDDKPFLSGEPPMSELTEPRSLLGLNWSVISQAVRCLRL